MRVNSPVPSTVIGGHSASEDARERAYDPAIHPLRLKCLFSMDARVKPGHDESRTMDADGGAVPTAPGRRTSRPGKLSLSAIFL
jgi:hypothetical protein